MLIFIALVVFAFLLYGFYRSARRLRKEQVLELIGLAVADDQLKITFAECGESLLPGQGFYQGTLTGTFDGHQLIVNAYYQAEWSTQPHRLIIHLDDERLEWSVEPPRMLCGQEAEVLRSLDLYARYRGRKSLLPCKTKA